jgi:ethanolamine utilization protein EutN
LQKSKKWSSDFGLWSLIVWDRRTNIQGDTKTKGQRPETKSFMFLGKVVGTVWSTKKTPDLEGVRFLIVHPYDLDKEPTRNIVVVADRLGAGTGEMVMCAFGKAARTAIGNQDMAIEAAVVGIVDRVDITDPVSEEMRDAAHKLAHDNGRP